MIKVCSLFIMVSFVAGTPQYVHASFWDFLTGGQAQADESEATSAIPQNSQNIQLLESSVNPDLNNPIEQDDRVIVQDDIFISNEGLPGTDGDYSTFEKSSASNDIIVYTVKEGDTLSEIADMFNISVNTIRWENNISGKTISVGQKLNILPITGVKHIVKKGDTITKIATKYDADVEDISIYNDIDKGEGLKQGDVVFVPNGIIKPVISPKPSSGSNSSSTKPIFVSNTQAPTGYYMRPTTGPITSPYGARRGGFHPGVDIGTSRGTPVVAAANGVVSKVISGCVEKARSCGGRYGNYIVIEHENGTSTRYAHLSKTMVSVGQSVSQGEQIATSGNTGMSTGPHLHFEVRNANGSAMRPPIY